MLLKSGKRRFIYEGKKYYWFIRADKEGILKIHILSEDKSTVLESPFFDSEVPVTPAYIRYLLNSYFKEKEYFLRKRER